MIVDDGASAHDAHLDAALSGYDKEFTALQLESGRLDGKRQAVGCGAGLNKKLWPKGGNIQDLYWNRETWA